MDFCPSALYLLPRLPGSAPPKGLIAADSACRGVQAKGWGARRTARTLSLALGPAPRVTESGRERFPAQFLGSTGQAVRPLRPPRAMKGFFTPWRVHSWRPPRWEPRSGPPPELPFCLGFPFPVLAACLPVFPLRALLHPGSPGPRQHPCGTLGQTRSRGHAPLWSC